MTGARTNFGDPSAALLEVLDPAQNTHFRDAYVESPFDLSEVLFIATANDVAKIPAPLRDRLEILEAPGYTDDEKVDIVRRVLWREQLEVNGLAGGLWTRSASAAPGGQAEGASGTASRRRHAVEVIDGAQEVLGGEQAATLPAGGVEVTDAAVRAVVRGHTCEGEQAVADGVGLVGVADDGVPVGCGQLAGDEGGGTLGPVLNDLGEVAPLGVAERREHPVVDGEQVEPGQPGEQPGVGAVAAADGELVQQARHADVAGGEATAAGPFDERAREEALADAGGAGHDEVVAFGDPGAGAQRQDLLAAEPAGMGEVDGLEGGGVPQLGGAEPAVELALLAGRPLGVGEQAEALLEAEGGGLAGPELVPAGVGHRAELHGVELVEGLFDQHGSSSRATAA